MRIVFFTCGGPFGLLPLETLAGDHEIAAIVMPWQGTRRWRRLASYAATVIGVRPRDEVVGWARRHGIPRLTASSGRDEHIVSSLRDLAPDLISIATFSWILHRDILAIPNFGVVNLHPSLLPRHRGSNPYFWTYYHDDREAGLTVHLADERADGGPILARHKMALPRGWPIHEFYLEAARQGAVLMGRAVAGLGDGTIQPAPQDETRATAAPRVQRGASMVDFGAWNVERVWHFLHGLYPRFREPLNDDAGRPVDYRRVLGYEEGPTTARPGTVEPVGSGWKLWCRDGYLHLSGPGERRSSLERG